jgi:exodeoxyribonuclease VII large subunit
MSTMPLFDRKPPADRGGDGPRVLRVAELNRIVRMSLEERFADLWVEGELGDVTRAASGHVYFTLNDGMDPACVKGVIFRADARRSRAKLVDGERVRMRGQLSLFEPRGTYQLIARVALPAGIGDLSAELERIRAKLEAEGLLDPARKRRLPRLPRVVGVVTSQSGAAIHDIIRVAAGRCPVRIVIAHCLVQGPEAPLSIIAALRRVQKLSGLDVVIVGRGGGSAEDLVAFNDERVAREIAACRVPTVSAVGHEVDVTIADLVADVRAATPSNAAEIVVPDRAALSADVEALTRSLVRAMEARVDRSRMRIERAAKGLADPRHALGGTRRRLAALTTAIERTARKAVVRRRQELAAWTAKLARLDPTRKLAADRARLVALQSRLLGQKPRVFAVRRDALARWTVKLHTAGPFIVSTRRARLDHLHHRAQAMSPLAVLARGYAIAIHEPTGRALLRATDAARGDAVSLVLAEGRLRTEVVADPPPPNREREKA